MSALTCMTFLSSPVLQQAIQNPSRSSRFSFPALLHAGIWPLVPGLRGLRDAPLLSWLGGVIDACAGSQNWSHGQLAAAHWFSLNGEQQATGPTGPTAANRLCRTVPGPAHKHGKLWVRLGWRDCRERAHCRTQAAGRSLREARHEFGIALLSVLVVLCARFGHYTMRYFPDPRGTVLCRVPDGT